MARPGCSLRHGDPANIATAEELVVLRSSSVAAREQQTRGSACCQVWQRNTAAEAEELGAVRNDIAAALERRTQLQGELEHLEAGLGEARASMARTQAQVCTTCSAPCFAGFFWLLCGPGLLLQLSRSYTWSPPHHKATASLDDHAQSQSVIAA